MPTRLEQLEKRLLETTEVWPHDTVLAGLLAEVGDARERAGLLKEAAEAYQRACGLYAKLGGPDWMATRMSERFQNLRPHPATAYRRDALPFLWVHHEGRWQRFQQSVILLGRSAPGRTDIQLPSGVVARRHAAVFLIDGRHVLRDLGSTNGTFLVRRAGVPLPVPLRLTDHLIADGDEAQIGDFVVGFALHDLDGSTGLADTLR